LLFLWSCWSWGEQPKPLVSLFSQFVAATPMT
jgi:hypothetical protein